MNAGFADTDDLSDVFVAESVVSPCQNQAFGCIQNGLTGIFGRLGLHGFLGALLGMVSTY